MVLGRSSTKASMRPLQGAVQVPLNVREIMATMLSTNGKGH